MEIKILSVLIFSVLAPAANMHQAFTRNLASDATILYSFNGVDCVVITPRICQRVLNAYRKVAQSNPKMESLDVMKKKMEDCGTIVKGYGEVLQALVPPVENNGKGDRTPESNIIFSELANMEEDQFNLSRELYAEDPKKHTINHAYDQAQYSQYLLSSVKGLKQVNDLIDLCEKNLSFFADGQFENGNRPMPTSKAPEKVQK